MEVDDEPTNEEIEDALKSDITGLWNLLSTLKGDKEFEEKKEQIKNGINIAFNIEVIVRGYYEEYPDTGNVKIRGYNKTNLYEFWDELREREERMKTILRRLIDEGDQKEIEIPGFE